jgi:prepilin-type N-terminal cleavage/methylation domain-containing protein
VVKRGYTLVEVLAALTLLVTLLFTLFAVLQAHALSVRDTFEERAAAEAAWGQIELIRAGSSAELRPRGLRQAKILVARRESCVEVTVSWRTVRDQPRSVRVEAILP